MAYARKVLVKTDHVQCFGDFAEYIWNLFTRLSDNSKRIDIVSDLYIDSSTKGNERVCWKQSVQPIITTICNKDQKLPVTIESFRASSTNKEQLQLFFIKWIFEKYDKDIPLYLGGCVDGDITGVVKVCSHIVPDVPVMKCGHEEADNRILFHINHAIKDENYKKNHCCLYRYRCICILLISLNTMNVYGCCLRNVDFVWERINKKSRSVPSHCGCIRYFCN